MGESAWIARAARRLSSSAGARADPSPEARRGDADLVRLPWVQGDQGYVGEAGMGLGVLVVAFAECPASCHAPIMR